MRRWGGFFPIAFGSVSFVVNRVLRAFVAKKKKLNTYAYSGSKPRIILKVPKRLKIEPASGAFLSKPSP